MEIQIFREGYDTPDRSYENRSTKECRRVRNRWIEEVKMLPNRYYIVSIPEDREYDMEKFEQTVIRKQREREEYEKFCAKHGIYTERQQFLRDAEKREDVTDIEECDIPIRKKTELDNM